jgi:anti-anti-sigma factor
MSTPSARHHFEWEDAGGVAIIRFTTPVLRDDRIIRTLFDQIDQELVASGRNRIIIDFAGLEAFASYAIGRLVALNDKLPGQGGRLVMCNLTPTVDEIIDIMSLRKRFKICRSERDALETFT